MTPDVVVDVGNTRIKWGRCGAAGILDVARLSPHDPGDWLRHGTAWSLPPDAGFVLAGVHPDRLKTHADWLRSQGFETGTLESFTQLNLQVQVEIPARVGLDRLLNAVAANSIRKPDESLLIVDAGSAVTVDWVDSEGAFRGGAIFPGLRLMAEALHRFTAKLPLVELKEVMPYPGTATDKAIACGILSAVAGGIEKLVRTTQGNLILAGGDAVLIRQILTLPSQIWPEMTLEGIRLSAGSAS